MPAPSPSDAKMSTSRRILAYLRRRWPLVLVAILVLTPAVLGVRYLLSAGRVAYAVVAALEKGDATELVRLASPKECERRNLTPETVRAYLQRTWLSGNAARSVRLEVEQPHYQDVIVFTGPCLQRGSTEKPVEMKIVIYKDAQGRWRLALSQMLYRLVPVCRLVPEGAYPNMRWAALAHSVGIGGAVFVDDGNSLRMSATGIEQKEPFILTRQR